MSGRDDVVFSQEKPSSSSSSPSPGCAKILIDSLKIFLRNKQIFLSIFALFTLPLSFLLFSLSLSSRPIQSQIYHLEAVAQLTSASFEARHLLKESRDDALSLFRLKLLYFFPSYCLSLIAAITAVASTASCFGGKLPTLRSAATAVRLTWKRPLVTTICIYALSLLYAQVPRTLAAIAGSPGLKLAVLIIGSGLEVYLMAILGIGLVVSVMEDRFGWGAIRAGSGLMEGRRLCGWFLSGLFVLVSGWIGWKLEETMDGEDLTRKSWTAVMGDWEIVGLICLYGMVVVWSYIVTTVFYCESRKKHVIRGEDESLLIAL